MDGLKELTNALANPNPRNY